MKTAMKSALVLLLLIFSASLAQAEEKENQPIDLQEIVVTAPGEDAVPEYVQDVIPEEVLALPTVTGSVLESLENQAGVQIRKNSTAGAGQSSLRLRGFGETRLRVLLDGVPFQRDGSYGQGPVDWSVLSPESVDHIEIHRGAGPAKFGNTLGGVVNIVSKKPSEKPETTLTAVYGAMNTWDGRLSHTWKVGPVGWSLSASRFDTDGYLRNNYNHRNNIKADFSLDLPRQWEIGLGATVSDSETGMAVYNRPDSPYYNSGEPEAGSITFGGPGIGGRLIGGEKAWGDESYAEDKNTVLRAHLLKKLRTGHVRLDYSLWNQDKKEVYFDAADSGKKIYERTTKAEDNNWSLQGEAVFDLGTHHIEAGGEYRRYGWGDQTVDYIDKSYFNGSINFFKFVSEGFLGQDKCLTYQALYLQDLWRLHPRMDLEFGLRQEMYKADSIDPDAFGYVWPAAETSLDENNLDPRLALTVRPWTDGSFRFSFGVVHRYPNSPEYFWWYLNKGTGYFNTDFKPEQARQYEASYEQKIGGALKSTVRYYHYDIENYITSTSVAGVGSVFYNIDQVTVKGLEVGLTAALPAGFTFWTNFTWQQGDKDGDPWDAGNALTDELPDLPQEILNVGLGYRPNERFSASLSFKNVSERQHFSGKELVTLDSYSLVNLEAVIQVWKNSWSRWDLLLSAGNLLDESYEERDGYPMPGTAVMGGLRASF